MLKVDSPFDTEAFHIVFQQIVKAVERIKINDLVSLMYINTSCT